MLIWRCKFPINVTVPSQQASACTKPVRYCDSALSHCSLSKLATIAQRGNYVAKHKHNYLSKEARENEEATTTGGLSAICG